MTTIDRRDEGSRRPALPLLAFVAAAVVGSAAAQNQVATQDLWVLDFGSNQIRTFNASSQEIGAPILLAGSGSARGFGFDQAGLAYVARGQDVRTYDGVTTALFAGPAQGIDQAQHVAVRPGAAQEVWVACGTASSNSKIIKFSSAGAVLQTLTNSGLDHPRRMAWNLDGSKLFVTSVNNKRIYSVDPATDAFTQVADLTSQNVIPIGISYDATRGAVWTVGDFGANGDVGLVDEVTGAYTTAIAEMQVPGLQAAASVFFDRFRVLNVAARTLNGGVAGVYRFDAQTGAAPVSLGPIATVLTSCTDVAPRPEIIGIGAPTMGTAFVLNASLSLPVSNAITFHAPGAANRPYAAALSPRWQPSCDPFVPGVYELALRLPLPDTRGIPLSLSDGGFLVSQSAAICCPPATPFPLNTILLISGFAGVLDAGGNAAATVDFFPAPPVINGVELSLVFITHDPVASSGFGRISDPICLTIVVGA